MRCVHARQFKKVIQQKDMQCPPLLEGYRSILAALERVGCNVWCDVAGGGTIVNIGARLPIGRFDDDIAWDTFRRAPQFRMVAFEGNNASMGQHEPHLLVFNLCTDMLSHVRLRLS
jgi:hypothetical protein